MSDLSVDAFHYITDPGVSLAQFGALREHFQFAQLRWILPNLLWVATLCYAGAVISVPRWIPLRYVSQATYIPALSATFFRVS
ncbi:hypothetical protein B0H17DRAFT_1102014 [Mycena rosella]|uniref:Uncharacterized protein n=1 Tax=Mycena rosella TaxID=1033263 RepID=A0AAD7CLB1_MYCRO|nr:hypothetical protein B0H17DRAFT_1102014 [Mycena rosella]